MQARTEPSTTPRFARGDKVSVITTNLFLRGQPNRKLIQTAWTFFSGEANWETQLQIETSSDSTLTSRVPCEQFTTLLYRSTTTSCPSIVLEGDDEEFDVSHISAVCIKSLPGRRGKYMLFMTHFSNDDIPPVWHRLNEVHRTTTLQDFLETPQWHTFAKTHAYIDFMYAHPTRIHESQ
jgi:hypothetical protein